MGHTLNEKIFAYTGTLQQATIPAGTTSIDVHLWGGAGGGAGGDRGGPGGTGAAGHYVTATSIPITSAQIGQTITVAVGGGGAGGTGGGNAPGGTNGKSITGYSGGTGGNSGPSGSSGSGGGGGGATVVSINGQEIAVAGGGGGGAGAGIASNGTSGINTNTATGGSPGTLGENGAGHTGDGGGAGAGGGGTDGGTSGNGGSGDNGGTGGKSGSNNAAGGTEDNGSGTTPGGTADVYYTNGIAVGGNASSPGGDGRAAVIFNTSVATQTKVGSYTQNFTRSLNSSSDIVDFFNSALSSGNTPSTYQHGWWVVSPALTSYQWQGYPFWYNNSIFIDQADVTRYGGTNSSDTTITIGNTTYTRTGSGVGGNFVLTFNDGSTETYNIQVYSYTVTGAAGWRTVDNAFTKVGGTWKRITAAYSKIGGVWKALFSDMADFTETAAGFGDATGGSSSGTPGSGGGCFVAGTMITMADGSQKPVEQVDIKDKVAVGGFVFATGKFLIDNLYDYKGIKVSGAHMVKEDGKWTRVEDSRHGVSLGDNEHIVYVFGAEHRRILINGILFTDYFELSEQQELTNHGEQFFSNWQDHDRQIHDKNVNILNA